VVAVAVVALLIIQHGVAVVVVLEDWLRVPCNLTQAIIPWLLGVVASVEQWIAIPPSNRAETDRTLLLVRSLQPVVVVVVLIRWLEVLEVLVVVVVVVGRPTIQEPPVVLVPLGRGTMVVRLVMTIQLDVRRVAEVVVLVVLVVQAGQMSPSLAVVG